MGYFLYVDLKVVFLSQTALPADKGDVCSTGLSVIE